MNRLTRYFTRPGHMVCRIYALFCYALVFSVCGIAVVGSPSALLSLVLGALMVAATYAMLEVVRHDMESDRLDAKFRRVSARKALRNAYRSGTGSGGASEEGQDWELEVEMRPMEREIQRSEWTKEKFFGDTTPTESGLPTRHLSADHPTKGEPNP